MGNERRKQDRKKLDQLLELFDVNSESPLGKVVDISLDGIMIVSQKPIPTNKVWQLRMEFPSQKDGNQVVLFGAESLWCDDSMAPGQYWTGLHVIDISSEDFLVFKNFVEGA